MKRILLVAELSVRDIEVTFHVDKEMPFWSRAGGREHLYATNFSAVCLVSSSRAFSSGGMFAAVIASKRVEVKGSSKKTSLKIEMVGPRSEG